MGLKVMDKDMTAWAIQKRNEGYSYREIANALYVSTRTIEKVMYHTPKPALPALEKPNVTGCKLDEWVYQKREEGYTLRELSELFNLKSVSSMRMREKRYKTANNIKDIPLVYDFTKGGGSNAN